MTSAAGTNGEGFDDPERWEAEGGAGRVVGTARDVTALPPEVSKASAPPP